MVKLSQHWFTHPSIYLSIHSFILYFLSISVFSALASIVFFFSFSLRDSWLLTWSVISYCNLDILGIMFWVSGCYLHLPFEMASSNLLQQRKEEGLPYYFQAGLEVQVPHSTSIDTWRELGVFLSLYNGGVIFSSPLELCWYFLGW